MPQRMCLVSPAALVFFRPVPVWAAIKG